MELSACEHTPFLDEPSLLKVLNSAILARQLLNRLRPCCTGSQIRNETRNRDLLIGRISTTSLFSLTKFRIRFEQKVSHPGDPGSFHGPFPRLCDEAAAASSYQAGCLLDAAEWNIMKSLAGASFLSELPGKLEREPRC